MAGISKDQLRRFARAMLVRFRLNGRSVKDMRVGALLFHGFTVVAVLAVGLAPFLRAPRGALTRRDWLIAAVSLAAALYLRFADPIRKKLASDAQRGREWKRRKLSSAKIILDLELKHKDIKNIGKFTETILDCIASSVAEMLDLPRDRFCANLLVFGADISHMKVAYRSEVYRRTLDRNYSCDNQFTPWNAIQESKSIVEDDVQGDPRWGSGQPPPYRSIFVLPITRSGNAYGALTVDCTEPYAYLARKLEVEILVQPYVSLLALTFTSNNVSFKCPYDPPRH